MLHIGVNIIQIFFLSGFGDEFCLISMAVWVHEYISFVACNEAENNFYRVAVVLE